jgi:hypothetical protein
MPNGDPYACRSWLLAAYRAEGRFILLENDYYNK